MLEFIHDHFSVTRDDWSIKTLCQCQSQAVRVQTSLPIATYSVDGPHCPVEVSWTQGQAVESKQRN